MFQSVARSLTDSLARHFIVRCSAFGSRVPDADHVPLCSSVTYPAPPPAASRSADRRRDTRAGRSHGKRRERGVTGRAGDVRDVRGVRDGAVRGGARGRDLATSANHMERLLLVRHAIFSHVPGIFSITCTHTGQTAVKPRSNTRASAQTCARRLGSLRPAGARVACAGCRIFLCGDYSRRPAGAV